jgi:periplasmic protein TonB
VNVIHATNANVHRIEGWLISLVLHGLLLSATLPLFRHVPITTPAEPFRWDITLVQSAQRAHEPLHTVAANTTEQQMTTLPAPVPVPAVAQESSRRTPSYAERIEPVSPIHESAAAAEPRLQHVPSIAPTDPVSVRESTPLVHNVTAEPVSSTPASEYSPMPPPPMRDPAAPEREPAFAPTVQEEAAQATAVTGTGNTSARAVEAAPPRQPHAATPADATSSSTPHADYSWLQRAIFQRLEELKRSSRPSLDQSSPLKVLVKAVVSNEGHLMETEVVKSSGVDRIDKEAMALVQRAFPIQLDRSLDRQRIVMRIPITYSRE